MFKMQTYLGKNQVVWVY